MHKVVNPQQARLLDPFDSVLTEKTLKRLFNGWSGVFRHIILELMPVNTVDFQDQFFKRCMSSLQFNGIKIGRAHV